MDIDTDDFDTEPDDRGGDKSPMTELTDFALSDAVRDALGDDLHCELTRLLLVLSQELLKPGQFPNDASGRQYGLHRPEQLGTDRVMHLCSRLRAL